ncbi:MAG: DUF1015 family protein [Phycisphaera sp.]|nr:DUF1015 family protein [Phycisphaera sp.]
MPELQPIRAIRFPTDSANHDISSRIAPPYDVLDEGPKRKLLDVDAHNIVAIDLPVTPPKTVGPDAAYADAGELYRAWREQNVLVQDERPAVYAYEQVYNVGDESYARRGMFAALTVEQFGRPGGGIHRHEKTIKAGTDDRFKLMTATAAQLSPIFGVYDDKGNAVAAVLNKHFDAREPDFHGVTANDRVDHRVWIVDDPADVDAVRAAMATADVFIADGHHRYTTALNYHEAHPESAAAAGCLFVLVPIDDPGLLVLPTHRVLCGVSGFDIAKLIEIIKADGRFTIQLTDHGADGTPQMGDDLPRYGHHAFGVYNPTTGKTYAVSTPAEDPLADLMPERPAVWRTLDVAVFHHLFVDELLRPNFGGDAITYKYPHELSELVRLSHDEPDRVGVIMQATPLRSVCEVSLAGDVMPPKSTFFFPKLATGLVINPLD